MGKINVDGFLREYSVAAKQQGSAMETFIKKHIVTDYINIASKIAHCNVIIDNTCYIEDGGIKVIKFNRVVRHIWFIMKMIDLYTDNLLNDKLEFEFFCSEFSAYKFLELANEEILF